MTADSEKSATGDPAIEGFRPDGAALLGEGLWGRVYDLGDGTVLKVARESCAGIGDGRMKIANEYAGLMLLSATEIRDIVPLAHGFASIPGSSELAREGFSMWLRTTRLAGTGLSAEAIDRLPANRQSVIGESLGRTLARLHAALDAAARPGAAASIGNEYRELDAVARRSGDPLYRDALATLARERDRMPIAIRSRACHGDFNVSNILFAHDRVCGVVDFAEWGFNFPEKDASDIINELPALSPSLRRAYQAESGIALDDRRLVLGIAENALYGALIGERQAGKASVISARALLRTQLEALAR
jgi:aminoglycoside phosphotransferase (APT) family kinase protein